MDQVKTIISTYLSTRSIKATARQLKVSKNTVKEYLRRCEAHDKDLSEILKLDDEQLGAILYGPSRNVERDREKVFSEQVAYWLKELRRVGVTRYLLWEEYRITHPQGYGYSRFCERLKKEIARRDLTIQLEHAPGEVMMVDFAGKKLHWVDADTGEVHACEVLVCVFPHSQYSFVIALPTQQIIDFVYGLNQALLFFGGVPKVILSDNLASYVSRADKYEPKFTQLCEQLAAHFQVDLQATRVAKPKDKASVENAVGKVYMRIYAPLRDEIFHGPEALNQGIRSQLGLHNTKPYQKKAGCRQEIFLTYELPEMRSLPSELFEIKKITKAKAQRNYHVFIWEEKNFYSVPYQYVGEKTEVVYTSKIVEVFLKGRRIAIHKRLFSRGNYRYQTNPDHMPKKHHRWKEIKGYDAQYFLSQAQKIGPATHWAIQQVLVSRIHEAQSYNSCRGILRLGEDFSAQRLENAAHRCRHINQVSYHMLKRILHRNLDQAPPPGAAPDPAALPAHENIRGPQNYQ